MSFYSYPSSLPVEEGKYLAPILRGTVPDDLPKALQAAWVIQGYAMNAFIPVPPPITVMSELQVADVFDDLGNPTTSASIPWDLILPIISNLLMDFLKKKLGGK